MGREQSHSRDVSVASVLTSLLEEDYVDELSTLEIEVALLSLRHGLSVDYVMDMSWGDYLELYTPLETPSVRVTGRWDKVYYGEAAFRGDGDE